MENLRDWLCHLEQTDRLAVARPGVNLEFELMAILETFEGKKATFFPQPSQHSIPVVGGTLAQRAWAAEALGIPSKDLLGYFAEALRHPLPWKEISQDQAPVNEVIHDKDIDIRKLLPIVTTNERDAGPYITCGLVHGLNLETKKQNVSIHRMQVHAPDKLGILMLPRDLYAYYQAAERKNLPLPVTITIGHDPITELASQAIAPRDLCELEVAGALRKKPISVVKSFSHDVFKPAQAEISIEGHILPHWRVLEGPFGEFPKYYTGYSLQPFIQITCVTHRHKPIYKTNNPSGFENIVLGGIPREASLLDRIRLTFPNVIDLRLTPGGLGRFHMVVKMQKGQYGEAKNVIAMVLGSHYDIKQVIVVDDDVDIDDHLQVEWAVATRFQADRDLVVLHHCLGSKLDPSAHPVKRGLGSKIGLDATKSLDRLEEFYVTKVPGINQVTSQCLAEDSALFTSYCNSGT